MKYVSTRDGNICVDSAQAILRGISKEGGLFVPDHFPKISLEFLEDLRGKSYLDRAVAVLSLYLTDFTQEELRRCVEGAYASGNFEGENPAPISVLSPDVYLLELWHGPTCAFKDMALQLLPYLMSQSNQKAGDGKTIVILVATSGDTGKAALEGFQDVAGTKILVFYPQKGVSAIQKLQMVTQRGENVGVAAVEGNFDDCQSQVKEIFTNPAILSRLEENGLTFSRANSINWGRLVPQIIYYISAYCDLVADEEIPLGEPVNICVPTGNFGNILAAYYAKQMGLPVSKLICASNENNVLTDFIRTGVYDRNRPFYLTTSPSMDILISSNLERLIFELTGRDHQLTAKRMDELKGAGRYSLTPEELKKMQEDFYGGFCTDAQVSQRIAHTFQQYSYVCDPHTAVALEVCDQYRQQTGDETRTIVASTASPFKFTSTVLGALGEPVPDNDFAQLNELSHVSGMPVPPSLAGLEHQPVRFDRTVSRAQMEQAVYNLLGLK